MSKFRLRKSHGTTHYISNGVECYLHSDGSILSCCEFWPTEEQAQAVLDKFQPKHVWKHGDMFKFETGCDHGTLIYLEPFDTILPTLEYVDRKCSAHGELDYYLDSATFLFNVNDIDKDKL